MMQEKDEQRTEEYMQCGEGVAQSLRPQQHAKSASRAASLAGRQGSALRTTVGVFDSGVGGQSVINTIQKELPDLEIIYKDDKKHLPYGNKTVEEIHQLIRPIFKEFIDENCKVIVIACNTVTTSLIKQLREEFNVPMVGMEPAVKPAAEATKSKVIAVCATPRTLESERYSWLKDQFTKGVRIIEPDCSDWALMIENDQIDRKKIAKTIRVVLDQGADQIVLGCTHYHWIEDEINEIAQGKAAVIQPEKPVVRQLKTVLEQLA
jgi:glutamate racemase